MRGRKIHGLLCFFVCLSVIFSTISFSKAEADDEIQKNELVIYGINRENTYQDYIEKYKDFPYPEKDIIIPAIAFSNSENAETKTLDVFEGEDNVLEWSNQKGWVEWAIDITQPGLYSLCMKYFPIEGKSRDIELELSIDGDLPFDGAGKLIFSRIWKDAADIIKDNRDNELRPSQIEAPAWREEDFVDSEGAYNEPYKFYFNKGKHTLRLTCIREPLVIKYLKLYNSQEIPSYNKVLESYEDNGYKTVQNNISIKFQAEKPYIKSDPVLHPIFDRSSPATEPYHPSKIRLNTIGSVNWRYPGQWITWKFDVPENGLYKIAMRYRQDAIRGFFTTRKIYIDGEMPFRELGNIKFPYDTKWSMKVLGDDDPYLFYLPKGTHELTMEVSLGDMAQTLRIVEDTVYSLNYLYRKIIMITGINPDPLRDYYLEKEIPDLIPKFNEVYKTLMDEVERIEAVTGQKGTEAALLLEIANQLESMARKPETISERLSNYRDNVTALGAWILRIREQPLELDYIIVDSPDRKLPKANANFIRSAIHEIRAFIASFFEDYNNIGNVYDNEKSVKVWVSLGRDQAQIIKSMIDDMFTPETGITVNLSLVQGALLQATMAGKGPDVALNVGRGEPVNLAVRGALVDLDRYGDFNEIGERFTSTAMIPYEYNGHYYALPETQSFHMMFYRKDIFDELGIMPPETWDEMYRIMPVIQRNNMEVGLPYMVTDAWSLIGMGMGAQSIFPTLLYQHDGQFYKNDHTETEFDEPEAIAAFKEWTGFYTHYSFPLIYDFYSRFRTGQMPVGIQHYTFYNMLSVAAPEIRNLWEMAPVPGTRKQNGEIDRSEGASGSACIIMSSAKDKDSAWKFLKWWTSAEVQARYGREQESIMGPAARYNPANVEAFESLPWGEKEYQSLKYQWNQVKEAPEVPGGYYTSRNIDNAFRTAVFNWANPREVLFYWNRETNKEIKRKRLEFGLD